MLPDGGFARNFLAGGEKTRPVGKAAGYDKSQRACEPSDTSQDFFDSLSGAAGDNPDRAALLFTGCGSFP